MWRQPRREALVRVCRDPLWYGIEPLFLFQRECLRRTFYGFFIFVVKNKWTIWGRFHFYTNGPFWVKCQNGGFGAILLVSGMVPADAGPGWSAADRHEPAGHAPVLFCISDIWGGAFYLFLFAGDVATLFSTPPLVVNLVCSLFCLD